VGLGIGLLRPKNALIGTRFSLLVFNITFQFVHLHLLLEDLAERFLLFSMSPLSFFLVLDIVLLVLFHHFLVVKVMLLFSE
jgi:hypothetical protein